MSEELLDEVRLAVGEACSRAVALHRLYQLSDLIDVEMTDGPRFSVRVLDRGPAETRVAAGNLPDPVDLVAHTGELEPAETFGDQSVTVGMGLALLTGLVDDLDVGPRDHGPGTSVRMSWPAS